MKQKLLIIGAGNIGGFISYNIESFGNYELLGFLDDDPKKIGTQIYGSKVLGSISSIDRHILDNEIAVVIGIGNPNIKSKIASLLQDKNIVFPNFIGENVWISQHIILGKGLVIYPGTSINYETVIGDFSIINMNCAIGHNCELGKFSTLAPGVNLGGFTIIGQQTDFGIGATTIQGVSIGENVQVGGQTMIIKSVGDNEVVVGNPARLIKTKNALR